MDQWQGKVAVVTGASSGIGHAIAESLVKAGVNVIGAARRVEKVQELAKQLSKETGTLHARKVDITNEQDVLDLFHFVKTKFGGVDILINNAGVLAEPKTSSLSDGATENWLKVINTNVVGLCVATREAVRSMKARNVRGHIVHISSVAGRTVPSGVGPIINVYPASKFAVQALAEVLHQELVADKSKIKVSIVAPGAVQTEILTNTSLMDLAKDRFESMTFLKPKDIADAVVYVLGTPPNVLIKDLIITPVDEIM